MPIRSNWGRLKGSPKAVTLPADLEAELEKLRASAPPPPSDAPIYAYLEHVYELQKKIAGSSEWEKAMRNYHSTHASRTLKNFAGLIFSLTADDHITSAMKYKYITALEYASANHVKPKDLKSFVKKCGGFNKCVELWNQKYGTKRRQGPRKKKP